MEEIDPLNGNVFVKRSFWEDGTLVTTARDPSGKKADFVTKRFVNVKEQLVQVNEYGTVSMQRILVRV